LKPGADDAPCKGMAVVGWPVVTVMRKEIVAKDVKIVGKKDDGHILKRRLPLRSPRRG